MELIGAPLNVENCEHFSIRGYAAKVRKTNRSICWPFPGQERDDILQPIFVPEFKYWKCTNCVKIADKENLGENVEVPNHKCGLAPRGACSHQNITVPSPGVVELSPKVKATKGRLGTSSAPVCLIDVDNGTSLDTNSSVHIHPSEDGSSKPGSHHIEENVDEARKENDVSAVKSKAHKRLEVNAATTVNLDTCPLKGSDGIINYGEEEFTSHRAIVDEDKENLIKDFKFRKSRRKRLRPNLSSQLGMQKSARTSMLDTGAHEDTNSYSPMNESVNAVTPPKCSESSHQTLQIGHFMSRSPGTTGKRKQIKVRTLGNILSRCSEKEAGSSSSGTDASFGIDLNLSPTHQVVKTKKRKDMEELEKEYMEVSSPKPLLVATDSSGEEEQQAAIDNYRTVSSCSKKGQNVEIENGDSSSLILQDEMTPRVQIEDEHTQLHHTGTPYIYPKSAKDASSEREFDAKPPMAGVEVIQKNKEIMQWKFPVLLPENLTKRPTILKKPSGQIGNRSSQQQSSRAFEEKGNAASEQASVADIPMDVVELMAKHQHERRLSARENSMCMPGSNTNNVRDSNEQLNFLQRSKFPHKVQYNNEGTSTVSKKTILANLPPSYEDAPQNGSRTKEFCFDQEQSRTFKGFTAFPGYQDKSSRDTQFPVNISSRNFGNQCVRCPKNKEAATSRAHIFFYCPSRDVGHDNSTFLLNKERPSSRDQFLVRASGSIGGGSDQNISFLRNQEKTMTGAQFLVGSSKTSGSQSSIYSQNQKTYLIRKSLSNNPADLLIGHTILQRHHQSCSKSSEAHHTSQQRSWQSSDQRAQSSTRPECLPQNSKPQKFASEYSTPHRNPHCLQLFPESSMNANPSPKSADPSGNHWEALCPSSQKVSQQSNMLHDHRQLEMLRFAHSESIKCSFFPSTADYFIENHHPESSSGKLASVPESNTASISAPALVANIGCSAAPVPHVNGVSRMDSRLKSFRDQWKGKEKVKEVRTQAKTSISHISGKNESAPILHLQKGDLCTAVTIQSPSDSVALKDSTNRITCKRKQPETVCPTTDFCFINRNPAEFTVPEAGNSYMTGYGNVKLKENILSRDRTEMVESGHNKKPKKVRFADIKDI